MPTNFLGLIYRTVDMLKWGTGKGSNLTASEVDNNFWALEDAISDMLDNPVLPKEITSISVTGNQMTIHVDGGGSFGPFTLPTFAFRFTGDFVPSHAYLIGDIFLANDGMYLVLQAHTSASGDFNPADGNIEGPYYQLMIPFPQVYDVGFWWPAKPGDGVGDGAAMFAHIANRDFFLPASLTGTNAELDIAPTADLSFPIKKNLTVIGSIDFAASSTTPTYTFTDDVQFTAGDRLRVMKPTAVDDTAIGFALNFAGTRGEAPTP